MDAGWSLQGCIIVAPLLSYPACGDGRHAAPLQQVTAYKVDPARLAALNARLRGMRLGNFEFVGDQLRLGDLRGNR